ncbi:MAG: prolipoprotein diacylglyceryl transferase [Phycisphaerae bacterium]|nr:prolipoprotein diacylglyceryl transferase [Phycisphaerae bacterium]
MHPVLFTIPGINFSIPSYGFMMMLGFLTAILWAARRAQRSGGNPDIILNCGFIALICGVVGARAMFVIHYWDRFAARGSTAEIIMSVINVTQGGIEFYGGFVLSVVGVVVYLALWHHSLRWYLDIVAPSAMVGLAFGRVGCFLNGCCWGGVCTMPWAVTFPCSSPPAMVQWSTLEPGAAIPAELIYTTKSGLSMPITRESLRPTAAQIAQAEERDTAAAAAITKLAGQIAGTSDAAQRQALTKQLERAKAEQLRAKTQFADVRSVMRKFGLSYDEIRAIAQGHRSAPVHPTQLYSVITAALLALLLDRIYWRRSRDGQVICVLLLVQPIARYLLEVIRADNPVDTLGFTVSQAIALTLTLIGLIGLVALRALPLRSPRAKLWEPPPEEPKKAKGKAKATA